MIEFVKGQLTECTPTYAVVDAGGVGYYLSISLATYTAIKDSASAQLLVHEAIREDAYNLFGFATREERDIFRLLISVSGVGTSTARIMLSAYPANELQRAILGEDINALNSIKGIGLKTAQRIIVELKDKVGKMDTMEGIFPAASNNRVREEALSALEVLGFPKAASQKVVDKIIKESPDKEVADIVKSAIKML